MMYNQKLRAFGDSKLGSVKALAEALDMKPASLQSYLSGESKPGFNIIQKLYILGCDITWLINDNDERSFEDLENAKIIEAVAKTYSSSSYNVELKPYVNPEDPANISFLPKYHRIYIVDNESIRDMEPILHIGNNVITDTRMDPQPGDLCLCKFFDNISGTDKYVCKYFKGMLNESIAIFSGYNKENSDIYINMNVIQFVHKVVFITY